MPRAHSNRKQTAFTALFQTLLEYSSTVWDPFLEIEKEELEKILRRGARFVFNDYSRTSSVTAMLSKLDWVPLAERRRDARLTLMFKIINDLIAIPAEEYLTKSSSRTRSGASNSYRLYTTNTSTYANSFFPRTIKDWNSLPIDIKAVESLDQFKEGLASRDRQ